MSLTPQGRLQRAPDFTGQRLTTFKEVIYRHGLPGLALGLVCLATPAMYNYARTGVQPALETPLLYTLGFVAVLIGLVGYSKLRHGGVNQQQLRWILYLGALSAWEEWVFRLALPYWLQDVGISLTVAVIISNLLFAGAHYFTLRWRWQWCLGAFLGGLALSRQMHVQGDLLLLIGIHWVGTFLNTPRPPDHRAS